MSPSIEAEVERVFRAEYGRAVAILVRVFGDISIAEDAVADAFTIALSRWPTDGTAASVRSRPAEALSGTSRIRS